MLLGTRSRSSAESASRIGRAGSRQMASVQRPPGCQGDSDGCRLAPCSRGGQSGSWSWWRCCSRSSEPSLVMRPILGLWNGSSRSCSFWCWWPGSFPFHAAHSLSDRPRVAGRCSRPMPALVSGGHRLCLRSWRPAAARGAESGRSANIGTAAEQAWRRWSGFAGRSRRTGSGREVLTACGSTTASANGGQSRSALGAPRTDSGAAAPG